MVLASSDVDIEKHLLKHLLNIRLAHYRNDSKWPLSMSWCFWL